MQIELTEEELQRIKAFISYTNDFMGLVSMEGIDGRQFTKEKEAINSSVKSLAVSIVFSLTARPEFNVYKVIPNPLLLEEYKEG